MSTGAKVLLGAAIVGAVAVGGYVLVRRFQQKMVVVDDTVHALQDQLDELDPVSRAAVVAKLTSDEARHLRPHRS